MKKSGAMTGNFACKKRGQPHKGMVLAEQYTGNCAAANPDEKRGRNSPSFFVPYFYFSQEKTVFSFSAIKSMAAHSISAAVARVSGAL